MNTAMRVPIDHWLPGLWKRIDHAYKRAFLAAACVSLLAFGFEMTNLTLHHDDLAHLMVGKPLVGYYLGRFVNAWLFFYTLQGHFSPFLHLTIGLLLMCAYGVLVAHLWGVRRTLDVALVAAIVCVFPYMAHVYQYNSAMVAYPLAHLLAAAAVVLSTRTRPLSTLLSALMFFLAFSIYQAVLANAATLFVLWLLTQALATEGGQRQTLGVAIRASISTLLAVAAGGILHVLVVKALDIPFDSAQGADQAFSLRARLEHGLQLGLAASEVLRGSRAFFVWPEAYLPQSLKALHALLLAVAAVGCLVLPRGVAAKAAALVLLAVALVAPRAMQFLHPQGSFHKLTLTAYALVIAASVMISMRMRWVPIRNAAALAATLLIAGYVAQCGWISTVNLLNTQAHFSTTTQILARLRSMPEQSWDGKTIAVVGSYDMPTTFPFQPATGVASRFMNAGHMTHIARLLRDEATFVPANASMPDVLAFAAGRKPWPSPDSVGVVDGVGVIVLSKSSKGDAPREDE